MGPGLAKARRGAFLKNGVLTREAEEALFELAERLSEGEVRDARGESRYFGSTMVSIDLAALARRWRGTLDREALRRAVEGSVRVRIRTMRMACADASHRAPHLSLRTAHVETRVHIAADELHLDIDLEVPLDARFGEDVSR